MVNEKYHGLGTAPSVIRELFAYGLQQAKVVGKENVFDYSLGNPSIPAPAKVNETIKKLIDTTDSIQLHGYSMAPGFENVRQAIADNLNARFNCNAKASELFMTCGCAPALVSVAHALTTSPEDEFIAIAPFFPEYNVFFTCAGAKLAVVPADTVHFQIDMDALEKTINEHSVAVVINSPNNPSGVVYTEETLTKIAELLERKSKEYGHPIYIVADEPYRELVYDGVKVTFIPNVYDNTIVCYSWSKSLSLPGERIGYVYVPEKCADAKAVYDTVSGAAREIGSVCPPTLTQKVIGECVGEMPDLAAYEENRNLLYNSLTEYGYECAKPDGAFYLFVKAPNGDAVAYSEKAKLDHNLLVVPGDGFACPGYFRLSYCVSNDMIKRSLPAFKAMIESYK
ncbi:MAG: pyridoxal phosphate-dependent aminotransferase [Mogibacterium diversum]|jgi:PLP-dependent aminotransferase|uniref:pyridoxal phosphate-dependent aminotransferase n=1 Tax=Mogibacterium TaxID=86331 RepID=UPI0017B7C833|nr:MULTISPECIES: pyridoxal phosphate-dependent aminotransferase [Mogibacterium]MBB1533335.1 pyridoxal phosphate-dependent aminotransferase [Mogibacterium sp.]MBF1322327.1 pyridoxal phosphate-dependent aminotransferase [Mogibacterium diversum]MBF1328831.1 pyridoxal phosphate-dependent aminotransferase [Mogibacterium diversum]MBF1337802.1 pyridoxal phosphate-dependent aminotransferase [Mogibacterium diversum]MBF1340962.1 pyridoxal phosphate-dependent aminotransferase [Mogibacterium diversum]